MSAHIVLNLLNELGKSNKMRGLSSNLSLFRNEFNKFNNTRARMLDFIYHMAFSLLSLKSHFLCKNLMFLSLCTQRCYGRHNVFRKTVKSILLHHSQTRSLMIKNRSITSGDV